MMYSKAGRATTEMFTALQHGNEILEPKAKRDAKGFSSLQTSHSTDKLSELVAKKFGQNNLLKDLAGIIDTDETANKPETKSKAHSKSAKELKKSEPFSLLVSRNQRDQALSFKKVSSGAAYYSPKYDTIEKKNPILVNYSKGSTKRMFDDLVSPKEILSAGVKSHSITLPPIADKPSGKVKGIINFDLQVARPDILREVQKKKICLTDSLTNPELPSNLSSVHRLPRIKFSRSLPRKDFEFESATNYCPSYSPNYEYVKRSLGNVGAELSKVTGRKPIVKEPYYSFETFYDYDEYVKKNNSIVYPKIIFPAFDKMPPRERVSSKANEQDLRKSENLSNSQVKGYIPQSVDNSMYSSVLKTRT